MRKRQSAPDPPTEMPKSIDEAVGRVLATMTEEEKKHITTLAKPDMIQFHRSTGMWIRNAFGLWGQNAALIASIPPEKRWPDDASMVILEAVWDRLQEARSDEKH